MSHVRRGPDRRSWTSVSNWSPAAAWSTSGASADASRRWWSLPRSGSCTSTAPIVRCGRPPA